MPGARIQMRAAATGQVAEYGAFSIGATTGTPSPFSGFGMTDWLRITGVVWEEVETPPGSGLYDWSRLDAAIASAETLGSTGIVFVLKTGHTQAVVDSACYDAALAFAEDDDTGNLIIPSNISCPVATASQPYWKAFVRAVIDRYGGRTAPVVALEIENEAATRRLWAPDIRDNGVVPAQQYIEVLRLAYEAKQESGHDTEIILCGIHRLDRVLRCEIDPNLTECRSQAQNRLAAFYEEILRYPEYFDAIDYHSFTYSYLFPRDISEGITWLKRTMKENGYDERTKPIYSLEYTPAILQNVQNRTSGSFFRDYFPYTSDFTGLGALGPPTFLAANDGAGPNDCIFSGVYTGLTEKVFAVAVRVVDVLPAGDPNKFIWTDDYKDDFLPTYPSLIGNNGTVWQGPITMPDSGAPVLLQEGISVTWAAGDANDDGVADNYQHVPPFGVGARAYPAGETGVDQIKVEYAYTNLDFLEDDPAYGNNPAYRQWFEAEQAREWIKAVCELHANGVLRTIHVQFHNFFPGYSWSDVWWKWMGFVRYTGGTSDNPTVVRKPSWWAAKDFLDKTSGWTTCASVNVQTVAPGESYLVCYRFGFASGYPVYVAWLINASVPAGYDGTESWSATVPVAVNLAQRFDDYGDSPTVRVTAAVTALDGNDDPVTSVTTLSGATTYNVGDTPIIIERV